MAYTEIPTSGGGFGSDTIIDLPNSASSLIPSLEFIASLPTNTAGSESAKWLLKLISSGTLVNSYGFEPTQLTTDLGNVGQTAWNWFLRHNGTDYAHVGYNNNGQLLLTATQSGAGAGIIFRFATSGAPMSGQTVLATLGNTGLAMAQVPIQQRQGINVASASTLVLPTTISGTSGNVYNITGNTTINLIDSTGWQNGSHIFLRFTGGPITLNHNQAAVGQALPMKLTSAANTSYGANKKAQFILMAPNSGNSADMWEDFSGVI